MIQAKLPKFFRSWSRLVFALVGPMLGSLALVTFTLVGLAPLAQAQTRELSSSGELLDGIVALVNDGVVLKSELQAETGSGVESHRIASPRTPAGLSSELVVDLAGVALDDLSWPRGGCGRVRRGE